MNWRLVLPLLLAPPLTACASLSTDADVRQATEQSLPALPAEWQVDGAEPGEVQIGWIDRIGDPVLSELVREAQLNNRSIQAAAANVESSWALVRQARSALFPAINGNFNATRTGRLEGPIPDVSQFDLGAQAQWEVDIWGRVRAGRNAAYASAQAVEADFRFAQYSLASAVASAYFTAIETQLQIGVAERTVTALAEIDRIVRVRYREGFASAQDTAITASDLATAIDSLENARGAARSTNRALELLLGRYPANRLKAASDLPVTPASPPAGIPSGLLERRPDVIAAERRVAAAFASLDQAKAARLPLLSLTGNIGGASSDLGDILDGPNLVWSIIGGVLQPIFDGGLRGAQVDQANADQRAAIAAYADTALTALNEAETSLDQAVVLKRRENALDNAARASARAYRLSQLQYKEGETDLIDVLNIQQRLFNAERGLVTIRRARVEQWVALNLALGGGWQSQDTEVQQSE
ncbi:Outer membrane efflux protein [Parasphingorhabdus marina DSM 22363]|uniref:Outer membrane efflux protein n=1 Tax=Parasphingorhabdus marina DSM 22363 TaxID=1123272 RepID=A0A1N6D0V3_9SPHN|nr:TolC family protein [Parasphingorhabdus marina]SIN64428.1 Outer membrane efflux protein [Parasphingorhabdus marina DSM 22363]